MKTFKKLSFAQFLIIICLSMCVISCNKNKTEIQMSVKKGAVKTSVKKEKKKKETKKKTKVSVDAIIEGKKFVFDKLHPKDTEPVIVFIKGGFYFRFIDINDYVVMGGLYSSDIFDNTPITFTQQKCALPIKEQATTKQKRSDLLFRIPGNPQRQGDAKNFYEGLVILEKFTDDMIVISFKGIGFPTGIEPKLPRYKDKLFPIQGKIIIEDYNVYDYR